MSKLKITFLGSFNPNNIHSPYILCNSKSIDKLDLIEIIQGTKKLILKDLTFEIYFTDILPNNEWWIGDAYFENLSLDYLKPFI